MAKPVIGRGLMGGNMLKILQNHGCEMDAMARKQDPSEAVVARGNARAANTAKEMAEACDILMLCVRVFGVVGSLVCGDDGTWRTSKRVLW